MRCSNENVVYAITKYSPLDVDSLLSSFDRTLDPNKKADFLYSFSNNFKTVQSKIVLIFNSSEYCMKRGLNILDNDNENIVDIINTLKKSL